MNESLAKTLYSYLLQQQRLPIPGLGMVLIDRVPAERVTSRALHSDEPLAPAVQEDVEEMAIPYPGQAEEEKASWVWYALVLFAGTAVLLFFHFHRLGWHLSSTGLQQLH